MKHLKKFFNTKQKLKYFTQNWLNLSYMSLKRKMKWIFTILVMKSIDVSDEDDLIDDTKNFANKKKLGYSNEKKIKDMIAFCSTLSSLWYLYSLALFLSLFHTLTYTFVLFCSNFQKKELFIFYFYEENWDFFIWPSMIEKWLMKNLLVQIRLLSDFQKKNYRITTTQYKLNIMIKISIVQKKLRMFLTIEKIVNILLLLRLVYVKTQKKKKIVNNHVYLQHMNRHLQWIKVEKSMQRIKLVTGQIHSFFFLPYFVDDILSGKNVRASIFFQKSSINQINFILYYFHLLL